MTAAVLSTRIAAGDTETPIRSSMLVRLWAENTAWRRSPVPAKPDYQPVADQLVVAHAFDRNQILQSGGRARSRRERAAEAIEGMQRCQ